MRNPRSLRSSGGPREASEAPQDQATSFAYSCQWPSSRFDVTREQSPALIKGPNKTVLCKVFTAVSRG